MQRICSVYAQHRTDDPGVSTATGESTDPGPTDKPQSSSNTVMVAGVAVPVVVLMLAGVFIVVMVIWRR